MSKYFLVKSNVKHNSDWHPKGSIVMGELNEYGHLVTDGAFSIIEGAESIEDAKAIVEAEKVAVEETQIGDAPAQPNTWGPAPDAPATDDVDTTTNTKPEAEEAKVGILGKIFGGNTSGTGESVETPKQDDNQ